MVRSLTKVSPDKTALPRHAIRISATEKKIGEDEFMAAAIGDVDWLKHTLKPKKGTQSQMMNFDKNGLAAVHISAIHGRIECLKWLIEHFKVDVNCPSSDGWTPLHLCISNQTGRRAFDCLQYLLPHGADPSITNDDGVTPMHQACSEGHVQCLKALLEAGATIDGCDCRGHKPVDLAKLWGHRTCARILAAEQWHQDKKYLASELKHLRKLSMQQVMQDIEADSPTPITIDSRGEDDTRTGKLTGKPTPVSGKSLPTRGETLLKSNSARRPVGGHQVRQLATPDSRQKSVSPQKVVPDASKESDASLPEDVAQTESAQSENNSSPSSKPSSWNKSTKVLDKSYINNLKDHYPRDEYTMLPKFAPERVPRHHQEHGQARSIAVPRESHTHQPNWLKKPAPPTDRILVMFPTHGKPSMYKPVHIGDVHKRKHYDPDLLPKPEVALHLCSDVRSSLFNMALATPMVPPPSSGNTYGSESNSSQNNNDDADLSVALNRIQKPVVFLASDQQGFTV